MRFHVSNEALKIASSFPGFQVSNRATKECWVRQRSDPSLSLPSSDMVYREALGSILHVSLILRAGVRVYVLLWKMEFLSSRAQILPRGQHSPWKKLIHSSLAAAGGKEEWCEFRKTRRWRPSLSILEASPLPPGFPSPCAWLNFRTKGKSACASSKYYS